MHTSAGISYQAQGYALEDGVTLPAWKIDEHVLCHELYMRALEDKRK